MSRKLAFRPYPGEFSTCAITVSAVTIHPDAPGHDVIENPTARIEALARAVLGRAILDATGRKLSGEQFSNTYHDRHVQKLGRIYFRERRKHPFGWGWIIDVLNLSEAQARRIESFTSKKTTDKPDINRGQ